MSFRNLRRTVSSFRLVSGWKVNLFFFTLLIGLVACYFIWQINQVTNSFQHHARDHARVLAGVVRLNIQRTHISQENAEKIMHIFLGKTAEFVSYLDALNPFSSEELTAFAQEAGLAGITIIRNEGAAEGPPDWSEGRAVCGGNDSAGLHHLADSHLYYLYDDISGKTGKECILVGVRAERIERIRRKTGMDTLLTDLTALPGINYVHLLAEAGGNDPLPSRKSGPVVRMVEREAGATVEIRLNMTDEVLVVGFDARRLQERIAALNREFSIFIAILVLAGLFFSWLLYRYQSSYLRKTREFERELGRQREEAALGRATATITHEIRNPLNAIAMGLQRLQLETSGLSAEHMQLLDSMSSALGRTNRIVANLQKFSKSEELRLQTTALSDIVEPVLVMYEEQCRGYGITVYRDIRIDPVIRCDSDLLGQVMENLVKNAVEAQPEGGYIMLYLAEEDQEVVLTMENKGFSLTGEQAACLAEPYFTTKTRGCGLGLAISERIIEAHGGRLLVEGDAGTGTFTVTVILPVAAA